ncbi:ADP-ribose pyrophosphatase [Halopseudomonas litoralis]|uniref:GDP-mannose pyrophosphatase n=1 Tax=Halopseudomonas litoralis TaxID=797277 RepID=A0A1H1Y5L1_9GAMM|nr:NUDIX hydrolase [Halopseudomonas litoralis]SDT16723.1 ADP-ribose pyrophosphatase [Halopseudomonas litoralis]
MKTLYENPWFRVVQEGHFHWIVEDNARNGAAVLAQIGNDDFLLLRVKRQAHPGLQLEIPRGYGEPGESSLACARRELAEETGYKVNEDQLTLLGRLKPNSAILASSVDLYLARIDNNSQPAQRDNEAQDINRISLPHLRQMLRTGEIEDSFTLAALAFLFNRVD